MALYACRACGFLQPAYDMQVVRMPGNLVPGQVTCTKCGHRAAPSLAIALVAALAALAIASGFAWILFRMVSLWDADRGWAGFFAVLAWMLGFRFLFVDLASLMNWAASRLHSP